MRTLITSKGSFREPKRQKMTLQTFTRAFAALVTISACVLLGAPSAMASDVSGAYKLEGAWVAKVVGVPLQWSYVWAPSASGRRGSAHGSLDVGVSFVDIPSGDHSSPFLIEGFMAGPDRVIANALWYGIREIEPPNPLTQEVVYIGFDTGELTFVGPGKAHGIHNLSFYLPSQDADGDGLPDAGEVPVATLQVDTIETRLPPPQ